MSNHVLLRLAGAGCVTVVLLAHALSLKLTA
jgi:hypothetical protein